MNRRSPPYLSSLAATAALLLISVTGCERSTDGLRPAPLSTDPTVFDDTFGRGVDYQAFLGSKVDAVDIDVTERFAGTASLKITVPGPGDPSGFFAGGAFVLNSPRNLSGYNALTFYAKASMTATLDIAGLGNDNTGFSLYDASWSGIPLTTTWTKITIPVPRPSRLAVESGLLFFAEGHENGVGYTVWFDDVKFETVSTISNPRPFMSSQTVNAFVGGEVVITGTRTTFDVDGTDQTIEHDPGYFTYASSNPLVAVGSEGKVEVVGGGSAVVTASLNTVPVTGTVTLNATAPPSVPAPVPTVPAADVISLYSNVYPNVPVDTWSAPWDRADVTDIKVGGDDIKAYTNLLFAGIEFASQTIDATGMTHFHIDVFIPPGGTAIRFKLVDFGANGAFGGGDDREHEVLYNLSTTPRIITGDWFSLDIPFTDFTGLTTRGHLAQLIVSGNTSMTYVDNVYFHR